MITIGCVLLHRLQGRRLPHARYSLGRWGILVNIVSLVYVTPIFVFSFFPAVPNPTAVEMNWAVVMVGGVIVLATMYYIAWGRKQYSPPNDTVEDYIMRAEAGPSEKVIGGPVEDRVVEKELAEESVKES
jgi:hypothetical protein